MSVDDIAISNIWPMWGYLCVRIENLLKKEQIPMAILRAIKYLPKPKTKYPEKNKIILMTLLLFKTKMSIQSVFAWVILNVTAFNSCKNSFYRLPLNLRTFYLLLFDEKVVKYNINSDDIKENWVLPNENLVKLAEVHQIFVFSLCKILCTHVKPRINLSSCLYWCSIELQT